MKYVILGYGIEGAAAEKYFRDLPGVEDVKVIENDRERSFAEQLKGLDDYTVVRSPGIALDKVPKNFKVWSTTNEFFAKCPATIIGVTGSKGKGTTATMIARILEAKGLTAHLVGNIGQPAIAELGKIKSADYVVYELSSFQLWDIAQSPHIAVLTVLEPDHLDVHADFDDYERAKANIVKFQGPNDLVVYNKNDQLVTRIAQSSQGRKVAYPNQLVPNLREFLQVLGEHNLRNAEAAVSAVWDIIGGDVAAVKKALTNFKGLPHHIELVRELNGVHYYDDSFSSNPTATKVAVEALSDPIILILGGSDKGIDMAPLKNFLNGTKNIKKILLIGQIKDQLADGLQQDFEVMTTEDFREIIEHARDLAMSGDVVLLSPSTASFGMFKNFYDRGEQFQRIVKELK
ncbi:MAG: UDP-N-acetylmuramoyl-L-alanine--D-glutamate ligase [Candidatus Nomurabacteria bacterium]|jgi:UDP-N-acetylmuramoylalanine--D-glutamate ligase|nr:UDP-N-acetylmuramoyl-L-alanine--D-glutamate ligase [Candidatus Nomurabacteria bacterium]